MKRLAYIFLFALLIPAFLPAQNNMLGGKNVLDNSDFSWKHVSTENFDLHYYTSDPVLATTAARYAEEALWDVCQTLDYKNRSRYAIYLFLSPVDYVRSNMSTADRRFKEGGVTPLRNNTIPLIFPGSLKSFQQSIKKRCPV